MKQKIVICAGGQVFEFIGRIIEQNEDYIIIDAKLGDIYIERKYLVFIQFLKEEESETAHQQQKSPQKQQERGIAKIIKQRLREDPLAQRLQEKTQSIPPSQLPDDFILPENEEDIEVVNKCYSSVYGPSHPVVQATNLTQAIRTAMSSDEETTFSTDNVEYSSPLNTLLGNNANTKKTRSR